jgi:hypothetical protein
MAEPLTDTPRPTPWLRPLALALGAVAILPYVLLPLLPDQYRLWNFAPVGAVALFAAARGGRMGLVAGLLLALGGKLGYDLINYAQHGYGPQYLPSRTVYACLALYAPVGWLALRNSGHPLRIVATAFLGSLLFFLVTNFASWVGQSLPYDTGPVGLLESYWMALPFWLKGTLLGDLVFTGGLFGLHAVLSRAYFPAERLAPVRVEGAR